MNSAKTATVPAAKSCAAYFFGTRLALATSFFFWLAAAAFACFCAAALLVAFGDLSPIGTMLRRTATGVNSTDGNVPSGLPHRGHSERCRRTSRWVATRSPSHPRGFQKEEPLLDVTRTVGNDRSPLIQEPGTVTVSHQDFGIRAIAGMCFPFEQQQEAEHALIAALFCAPDQLFDEGDSLAMTQLHRFTPTGIINRRNRLWQSGDPLKKS